MQLGLIIITGRSLKFILKIISSKDGFYSGGIYQARFRAYLGTNHITM